MKNQTLYIVGAILTIIAVGAVALFVFVILDDRGKGDEQQAPSDLSKLIFSLDPKHDEDRSVHTMLYPFSTTTPLTFVPMHGDPFPEDGGYISFSDFQACLAYMKGDRPALDVATSTTQYHPLSIERSCIGDDKPEQVFAVDALNDSVSVPSINDTGEVLFHKKSFEDGERFIALADSYDIYFADRSESAKPLIHGIHPTWINDVQFIYLRNDGLYMYDMDSKNEQLIMHFKMPDGSIYEQIRGNAKIGFSRKASIAAVSIPDRQVVILVQGKFPSVASISQIRNTFAFWPTFSPDAKYLALQVTDPDDPNVSPKVVFYSSEGGKLDKEIELGAFEQDYMFITDWIK